MVTIEENKLLCKVPTIKEVKRVVFGLKGSSACGPYGFSGIFYQHCWEVVKQDIYSMVNDFSECKTLPKSVKHNNLVLIPKKEVIESFSDLRRISLSNFINKVISRVLHEKLEGLLPKLISKNQLGFVKG